MAAKRPERNRCKTRQSNQIIVPRGRPHTTSSGDENDLINSGNLCINRLNWFGEIALDLQSLHGLAAD